MSEELTFYVTSDASGQPRWYPTIPAPERSTLGRTLRHQFVGNGSLWGKFRFSLGLAVILTVIGAYVSTLLLMSKPFEWPHAAGFGIVLGTSLGFFTIALRRLVVAWRFPPPSLELADWPLTQGEAVPFVVIPSPTFSLDRLKVSLLCREAVSFLEGTLIRRETAVVYVRELGSRARDTMTPSERWQVAGEIQTPSDGMPTFESRNNSVHWYVLILGQGVKGPAWEVEYLLVVLPKVPEAGEAPP